MNSIKYNLNELYSNITLREKLYSNFRFVFQNVKIEQSSKLYYRFNRFMFAKYIKQKYFLLEKINGNYFKLIVIDNKTNLESLNIYFDTEDIKNNRFEIESKFNNKSVILHFLDSEHFNCFINSIPIYTKWRMKKTESGYVKYEPNKLNYLIESIQNYLEII